MSPALRWISVEGVEAMHRELITHYGGLRGLRDAGLLASAIARPIQMHNYEPVASIAQLAASLGWGLAKNHAFLDGNKRIALASVVVFLDLNGHELACSEAEETSMLLRVSASEMTQAAWVEWVTTTARSKQPASTR